MGSLVVSEDLIYHVYSGISLDFLYNNAVHPVICEDWFVFNFHMEDTCMTASFRSRQYNTCSVEKDEQERDMQWSREYYIENFCLIEAPLLLNPHYPRN